MRGALTRTRGQRRHVQKERTLARVSTPARRLIELGRDRIGPTVFSRYRPARSGDAAGEGNKTVAWKLGISEHTVKFHVGSILSELNASSRTEAVTLGIRWGLILI